MCINSCWPLMVMSLVVVLGCQASNSSLSSDAARDVAVDNFARENLAKDVGSNRATSEAPAENDGSMHSMNSVLPQTLISQEPVMQTSESHEIRVIVNGISTTEGQIAAALYQNQDDYQNQANHLGTRVGVTGQQVEIVFPAVPAGEYAIRLFHDVNNNQTLDKSSFGIPNEPYAFSNNARGAMGPATWESAKFRVEGNITQELTLPN